LHQESPWLKSQEGGIVALGSYALKKLAQEQRFDPFLGALSWRNWPEVRKKLFPINGVVI